MATLTPEQAASVLLDRRVCRRSLEAFASRVPVPGSPLAESADDAPIPLIETHQAEHHKLILREMQRCMETPHGRLMIMAPPGSAKSTYATVVAPSWYLGITPNRRVILATYGDDLARRHGRRTRQLLRAKETSAILQCTLDPESRAADEFGLTNGSEYMACGMLGGITGNRAHGIVIDDPIKGRQDADSEVVRGRTWDAYQDDLMTRLIPGGWMVIINCMVGDTPVLMADGTEKPLRDIRTGDAIATYADGALASSVVVNWANQGADLVYSIKTSSGTIVRANERHPFLVDRDGVRAWVRVKNLRIGDKVLRAIGASGVASSASMTDASCQPKLKDTATPTTTRQDGQADTERHQSIQHPNLQTTSSTAMGLAGPNTKPCLCGKMRNAQFAGAPMSQQAIGEKNSALTIATNPARCEACSVITAMSWLGMEKQPMTCYAALSTYEITPDEIAAIVPDGREDVFDIQVAGTENFIANGLVSHNTRWHEDDPCGRILPDDWAGESGDIVCRDGNTWRVLCLQAECSTKTDPLGREIGAMLWPEWFDAKHWAQFRLNRRTWSSLYQQRPAPDDGILFRRDDMVFYERLPDDLRIIGASDYAVTPDGGDWTEHGIMGIAPDGSEYLLDWWRGQTGPEIWIERQIDMIARHRPLAWFGETGPIRRATEGRLRQRMIERNALCRLEWLPTIGGKGSDARAGDIIAVAGMGRLLWPRAAWVAELQRQCLVFPAGSPDDGVDTLALLGRGASTLGRKTEAALDFTTSAAEGMRI